MIAAVQGENESIPGGAVDVGLRRYNLKTSGSYESLEEIGNTVVAARGESVVRLRDLAEVGWSAAEERYIGRFNGKRAVFVTASMKDNLNVFDVRDAIYARLPQFEAGLPDHIRLEHGFDQSQNVDRRLSRLQFDFTIAIALVALTLLPLGLRAAGIVMISIPLSLAIGLAALYLFGFSLNQLSIAGFVVALGLLVDDSIVVVENIARHVRQGMSRREAAIAATDQIWLAVLGCTVTLLLAFVPLLFLPEGAGDFVRSLPAAVLFTITGVLPRVALDHPLPREPPAARRRAAHAPAALARRRLRPGSRDRGPLRRDLGPDARRADGRHPPHLRPGPALGARAAARDAGGGARRVRALAAARAGDRLQPVPDRGHPAVPRAHRGA